MRLATRQEIEYLESNDHNDSIDTAMIDEMSRRLDALRRYDQCITAADWRPHHSRPTVSGGYRPK